MVAASKMTFPQAHIEIHDNKVYYAIHMLRIWFTPQDKEEQNNNKFEAYFLSTADRNECIRCLVSSNWGLEGTWDRIEQRYGLWEKNSDYVRHAMKNAGTAALAMKNASEC